jgi:flagellar secretion chaperone FliS
MPANDAAATYQQVSAHGGSPVGLIVSLYDTILRDFRRALAALDAGNVETRIFELNHAITVIGHLQEVLDHKRGGEAAKRFEQFYGVTRGMIVNANAQPSRESINSLIGLYGSLRQAWHEADRKLQGREPRPPIQPLSPPPRSDAHRGQVLVGAPNGEEVRKKNWSA